MKDLRIALIQTDIHWEDIPANLDMLGRKVAAINEEVDLIVLPEMFSTGFSMDAERLAEGMDGTAIQWMKRTAAHRGCIVTGSLILYEIHEEQKKYYNRLVWMRPDGGYTTYDKRHLFSLSDEPKIYTAGEKRLVENINGWNICPMICYDLRFPVWARNAIGENRETTYDVLLYVANWPERRIAAWNILLPARAIENQSYVIGLNRIGQEPKDVYYSGYSSVIGPRGEMLYQKAHDADTRIINLNYEELVKVRRQFPFLKSADRFELK